MSPSRLVFAITTWLVFTFLQLAALAQQTESQKEDAHLKHRISELEAENRALRKILGEIQGALSSIPKPTPISAAKKQNLRIVVLKGDWGESQLEDIRRVCLSSAQEIWREIKDDGLAPILVSRSKSGPISLYQRGRGYEYQVRLDTANRAWAQCAFQFAHEFGHILCNYRNVPNPQLWFEESICELASLYSLRRMSNTWKTNPPYSNWKPYSKALDSYANNRINKYADRKESLQKFYEHNKSKLAANGTDRQLNGFVAIRLLPLFEKDPTSWQAIRYINLGPKEENVSLEKYLRGWYQRVPAGHRAFVKSIAKQFGVSFD